MNAEVDGSADLLRIVVRGAVPPAALAILCARAPTPLGYLLVMMLSLVASSWIHEGGHVLAYWRSAGAGRAVVRGRFGVATSVLVPDPRRAVRRIAAAGPIAAGVVGIVLIVPGRALGSHELVLAGSAFCLHALGLLPGCSDGNRVWGLDG